MIPREQDEGGPIQLVVFGIPMGHPDKEEGNRFENAIFRQHFAVQVLDRILSFRLWRILGQCYTCRTSLQDLESHDRDSAEVASC